MSARVYVDRLGRPLTDPDSIELRRMMQQYHRLNTIRLKSGPVNWTETVTAGEVAKACKTTADRVVSLWRNGYLCEVDEVAGAPSSDWWVWQDGE